MRAVGIKSLKNRLSEYVRLAAAGETVLVTDVRLWPEAR
jgi:antitoxin (DNA-binding transcriptional repressor) of toxin-antitoxin stability system